MVMRIETKQAPKPSQPEVVLSDGEFSHFLYKFGVKFSKITFGRSFYLREKFGISENGRQLIFEDPVDIYFQFIIPGIA